MQALAMLGIGGTAAGTAGAAGAGASSGLALGSSGALGTGLAGGTGGALAQGSGLTLGSSGALGTGLAGGTGSSIAQGAGLQLANTAAASPGFFEQLKGVMGGDFAKGAATMGVLSAMNNPGAQAAPSGANRIQAPQGNEIEELMALVQRLIGER